MLRLALHLNRTSTLRANATSLLADKNDHAGHSGKAQTQKQVGRFHAIKVVAVFFASQFDGYGSVDQYPVLLLPSSRFQRVVADNLPLFGKFSRCRAEWNMADCR
jgi:hypothetical protein